MSIQIDLLMIRVFLFLLFVLLSNKVIAIVQGESLICDKDRRGYNFITKDKVKVYEINLDKLNIISIDHAYELAENTIFIQKPIIEFNKEKNSKPIGWLFRKTLDYVSLDYLNGDWSRRFLWSCKIVSSNLLETRLNNKLNKLIKARWNKIKEFN